MLMFLEKIPDEWIGKVKANLSEVLVDHAHLERKAATSALNLEKYPPLFPKVGALNAIAIEELQHFQLVLDHLKRRNIPFSFAHHSPWIGGLMRAIRRGRQEQVIDHLIVAALIEGRSCEKFQLLAVALQQEDPELAQFYGSLVESEGNHYADYLIMAKEIHEQETQRRLKEYLNIEAELMRNQHELPILH